MLPTASIPPLLSLQYLLQNGSSIPMLLLLPPLSPVSTNLVHPSPAAVAPQLYRLHPSTSLYTVSTNLVHLSPCCCCPSSLPPPSLHFSLSIQYLLLGWSIYPPAVAVAAPQPYHLHPSTSLSLTWYIYPPAAVAAVASHPSIFPLLSLQYLLTWSIYPPAAVSPHPYHLHPSTSFCLVSTNMVHLSLCCCCSCHLSASCYSS